MNQVAIPAPPASGPRAPRSGHQAEVLPDGSKVYVAHLEARYNGEVDDDEASQASLVEEVERFLRDQRFE